MSEKKEKKSNLVGALAVEFDKSFGRAHNDRHARPRAAKLQHAQDLISQLLVVSKKKKKKRVTELDLGRALERWGAAITWPSALMITASGVRTLKEKPSCLTAFTSAASSGDAAWARTTAAALRERAN
jgi:hypothetical protein